MTVLRRVGPGVWTALAAVVVVVAVYLVGAANPIPPAPITTDALGPENTETAGDYIARAAGTLADVADPAAPRWALVSFDGGVAAAAAAGAAVPARISEVISYAAVPGAQTPAMTIAVPATPDPATMTARAQRRAADAIEQGFGGTSAQRGGSAAAAERLRSGGACVVGLVVRADTEQLRAIAARNGVAAVEALPADAVYGGFAVRPPAPLLS